MEILGLVMRVMIERFFVDINMIGAYDASKAIEMRGLQGTFF